MKKCKICGQSIIEIGEAKLVKVTLNLRQGEDGHWLEFKSENGNESIINLENYFNKGGIIDKTILNWAKEQF